MKNAMFTPPYKYYATMTSILLLLLQFNAFTQKSIYSLTDEKTKGTPTIRLRPTRFLVYQSIASSSKANAQKEFSEAISRNRNQVTQADIIPIGILNADIETPDEKDKKKDFVLMASPIQKDIFQANVQFQISPKLLQTNLDNQIESIEISFDNGNSWKSYKYEEQLIRHQFRSIGEQEIGFKINSKKGTYVTFATVDVKQLVRRASTEPKRVSAPAVKGGRIAANVNGAEYRIILGCDGIFNKPIIIAEGFDAAQNANLDDLEAKYFEPLTLYRNNGYDLVLVNYDNGRTWIQDNAQVLKAVINQVNATKYGNNKLVVIGESMSGLVARYALKQMENDGQNPNVSHFVAFDTPMRGANVPTGLIGIRRWAPSAFGLTSLFFSFLNDVFDFYPVVHAIDEPAAKQMLLTQQGSTPAPEFFQFQTEINNLGYPSQYGIKNIALVNGALDGASQRRYIAQDVANGYNEIEQGEFNQGDKFFDYSIWGIFDVEAWTHTINVDSKVGYGNVPFRIFTPASNFYLNSPINYDRHPGGRQVSRTGSVYTSFGFVPTFSSIDYRGTLNNNNDYYFNIRNFINGNNSQVTNSALTPFAAIYGDDRNDLHARAAADEVAFNTMGVRELGMINNGCIGCSPGSGGLAGTYFGNEELGGQLPNVTPPAEVNYHLDNGRPMILGSFTNGSARFEGSIQAPITGTYTFNMRSDDGCRVWFDGTNRVDDWGYYAAKDHPFQVNLTAGERKNIKIEWKQGGGGYVAEFYWTFNGIQSIVPACSLFPTATGGGDGGGGVADRTELGTASDNGASNPGGEGESQAFDNSNFTKWLVFSSTGNIVYDFANDDSYAINRYTITSANDDNFRDPRSWNLQGSNDNINWTTVNSQNNQTFPDRFQTISYGISNTTPYKQYRLNVTGNNGSNLLQIAEIQMFGPAGGGGCSPPSPPSISTNTTTAPAELSASGCSGTVTWSSGSTSNPLTNVGSGTYTATCTVSGCTSGPSNSIAIVGGSGGGGSCPTYSNPQWFHWDNASSSLWFAHYGLTGLLYAATDANPATPALTRQQLLNSGVTPTLANCFLDGRKSRIASGLNEIENDLEVFPNPTNGKIKLSFTLQKDENVWFNLYDIQGKNLQLTDFEGKRGRNEVEFDLQNYISGAYFIDLQYNQKREVRKVMKMN